MNYIKQLIAPPYTEHPDGHTRPAPTENFADWESGLVAPADYHWVPVEKPEPPAFDNKTHRLLKEWVNESNRKVLVYTEEELSEEEKHVRKDRKIWSDVGLFWNEFTAEEQAAIVQSADSNVSQLNDSLAKWRSDIWADDARIVQGMALLVALGILTGARRDEILGIV